MYGYHIAYGTLYYNSRDPDEDSRGWEDECKDNPPLDVNDGESPLRINEYEAEQYMPGCAQKLKLLLSKSKRSIISLITNVRGRLQRNQNDNAFIGNEQPTEEELLCLGGGGDDSIPNFPEERLSQPTVLVKERNVVLDPGNMK